MVHPYSSPIWHPPSFQPIKQSPLANDELVDVAVVGGGLLGLSAALHAARHGLSLRIIEANKIGAGAAGQNGGQVIPGLKQDPQALIAHFGQEAGERLVNFAASTADFVFDLIAREKLAVDVVRKGWIYAAHSQKALMTIVARNSVWRARGADTAILDADEVGALTGAQGYLGGWLDRRAGTINPLAYVLELARLATNAGIKIIENERVVYLEKRHDVFWLKTASGGEFQAKKVLIATNAASDRLIPGLAQTLVPLNSFQLATEPLSQAQLSQILPEGQAVSDSRRIVIYYRKSPDGRLVFGGRGRMREPRNDSDWAHLEHAMRRLFPSLAAIQIEKRWFGRVAVTTDTLPHFHQPEAGLVTLVGCQGRGIALMSALGPKFADYFLTGDPKSLPFPLSPIRPIPFHAFRQIGIATRIAWYQLLDAIER